MSSESFNKPSRKVWIFAGETSGDMYGAELARELQSLDPGLTIQGMGSSCMADAGVDIMVDSTELGVVGYVEVLKQYPLFRKIFNDLVARAERDRPDVVVLIDYPGFNLRFAEQMHARGIKVVYYISPTVWAWGKRRKPKLAKFCRHMLVIFPFEADVYDDVDLKTTFVGHPLVHILRREAPPADRDPNLVVLLPGSRFSEVNRIFGPMLETATALHRQHPAMTFVVTAPRPAIADRLRDQIRQFAPDITVDVAVGEANAWLRRGIAGIAASGTITVQAAILGLPLVVVYRMNPITYMLGRMLVKIPYFTMVNLVTDRLVFEEFIQGEVKADTLAPALERILPGGDRRDEAMAGIRDCVERLGGEDNASRIAAEAVLAELK